MKFDPPPVVLITGAAKRLGAAMCRELHQAGYDIAIHYGQSADEAQHLAEELNSERENSADIFQANLCHLDEIHNLAKQVTARWGHINALINNASTFYPTPLDEADEADWDDLMATNLKAPFFLARELAGELTCRRGRIVNIADINGRMPLKNYPVYSMAKAGNIMLTKSLALELAPHVQVNGIAPGSILWPTGKAEMSDSEKTLLMNHTPMHHMGTPLDIARLAVLLVTKPGYMTGQIIAVDGGLNLTGISA